MNDMVVVRFDRIAELTFTLEQARVFEDIFDACLFLFLAACVYLAAKNVG